MNLLPFAHLSLYTLFAPKRLHNHWVLQSSQEKLKTKSLCKIFGGQTRRIMGDVQLANGNSKQKESSRRKWEGVYFFPFPFPSSPTRFFFPSPQAPLHYDTKRRVAIVPPWAQKTFPLRIRSLLRSSPRSIPSLARKTSGTKGIGWLIPTDISYRISSNNSRTSINRHPRIIAPLEGIFNIIAFPSIINAAF